MTSVTDTVIGPFDRRYVLFPMLVAIALLLGLLFVAQAGQTRLERLNAQVLDSQRRQQSLDELLRLITDAEAGQRGFLITGAPEYLKPLELSQPRVEPALETLRLAYADAGDAQALLEVRHLRLLVGQKLGEIQSTLALQREFGADRAIDLVRTDVGKRTMDEIRSIVGDMQGREDTAMAALSTGWQDDLRTTRWLTLGGAVLNVLLIVLAGLLVTRDIRRREEQARALDARRAALEQEVTARTEELSSLSTHLQQFAEQDRAALSRELHDELGGLLIAARMDVSWLERHFPTMEDEVRKRFQRVQEALSAGVDVKRRVVEHLRPTLLDNMGLIAAVRWLFNETCGRAGLQRTELLPEEELPLRPEAAIGLFRLVQEALTNILKHAQARTVALEMQVDNDSLVVRIRDDGVGIDAGRRRGTGTHGLASMRHRVAALGGDWTITAVPGGGTEVKARLPLAAILADRDASAEADPLSY